jgi:cytochrome c-type biogenesis protein CcmH/NrfG
MSQSKGGGIALAISAIVVFALAPGRLRLLLPTLGAALLVAWRYEPLTAPFRDVAGVTAIRDAGEAALILVVLAVAIGLAYALVDARRDVSARVRRIAALALVALSVGLLGVGTWQVERHADHPLGWVEERWEEFKQNPTSTTGSSHLVNLGSNRYDFWRVGVNGFREHPVAGIGGRGFGQLYLIEKESYETPARSHSLALDALLETGLVGFALIGGALTLALVGLARRRASPAGLAALGALAYFAVHASGDWIWTFPAVGLPLFALVGIGLAGEEVGIRSIRARSAAAVGVAAFALLAFIPPWLSARLTAAALQGTVAVEQLRWARALDPLSVEPLLAEAALATTPASALAPLEAAVAKEPRAVGPRFLLGRAYLAAGRHELAREQLRIARRLSPDDELIGETLEQAERAAGSGGVAQSSG